MKFSFILFIALSFVLGCSTGSKRSDGIAQLRDGIDLTREEALRRSRQVSNVTYNLWFDLSRVADEYEGRIVIFFEMRKPPKEALHPFHLDFAEGKIRTLNLNGSVQTEAQIAKKYDGHRIHFSPDELQIGQNRIEIAFAHTFGRNGNGLYRLVDEADGKIYIYSNFEPYSANEAFPCFDQPDMKASMELTTEVPDDWVVVSNTLERDVVKVDGRRSWVFPPSPKLSTYNFAIHAGEFKEFKRDEEGMLYRIYLRHSMLSHFKPQEWFPIFIKGIEFYATQFGYPYPYSKSDWVIAPDLPVSLVENAAAVVLSEELLFRSQPTRDQLRHRENLILHGLAHMWLGNLVTPRWWSGLWLNESFAGFSAAWAQEEALNDSDAWLAFFQDLKRWAYLEDQRATAHPVDQIVADTDEARANFDGVTYGKGASILKQLRFYLGDDDFKEGLQRYFQSFAIRSASLADFLKTMGQASGKDLSHWRKEWFQTVGVNTVKVEWSCVTPPQPSEQELAAMSPKRRKKASVPKEPVLDKVTLKQEAVSGGAGLMTHKIKLGLFAEGQVTNRYKPIETFDAVYAGEVTLADKAKGLPCPDYIIPNIDDLDYVRPILDPKTEAWTREHLAQFEDPLLRANLWHLLWLQVLDGAMSPLEYGERALKALKAETKTEIVDWTLETLGDYWLGSNTVLKFLEGKERDQFRKDLEGFIRGRILALSGGGDLQATYLKQLLHIAGTQESYNLIEGLLNGKSRIPSLSVRVKSDPETRWLMLLALARSGQEHVKELLTQESKKDLSPRGEKAARQAEIQYPSEASKRIWWDRLTRNVSGDLNYPKLDGLLEFFHVSEQEALSKLFVDSYFDTITQMATKGEDGGYFADFVTELFPHLCDPSVALRAGKTLSFRGLPAEVIVALSAAKEEEDRCILIRKKWAHP